MHACYSDDVRKGLTALSSEDEYDVETAPEKRLRLAKEYLSNLQEEGEESDRKIGVSGFVL